MNIFINMGILKVLLLSVIVYLCFVVFTIKILLFAANTYKQFNKF